MALVSRVPRHTAAARIKKLPALRVKTSRKCPVEKTLFREHRDYRSRGPQVINKFLCIDLPGRRAPTKNRERSNGLAGEGALTTTCKTN